MKKILYTFLAVSIIFAACKKEENNAPSASASIVGVWTPTSVVLDTSQTVTIAGDTIEEFDFGDGPEVLSYSGSETMTPAQAGFSGNIELTADGKAITDDTSSYTYSNNVLTIIDEDLTFACSLTSTSLSLTREESMDTAFNNPGLMMFGFANGDVTVSSYRGMTIHCSRSSVVNTNVNQRVGNTNHSWFTKPKLPNILKDIK